MYKATTIKRNANTTDKVFLGNFEANLVPSIPPKIPPTMKSKAMTHSI